MSAVVRIEGVEPSSHPWEGYIIAVIRYPLVRNDWAAMPQAKQVCPQQHLPNQTFSLSGFANPIVKPLNRLGAEDGIRTHDLLVTNELLYQLSHFGKYLLTHSNRCNAIA